MSQVVQQNDIGVPNASRVLQTGCIKLCLACSETVACKTAFERIKGPVANVPAHMESPSRKQTSRSLYRGPITPWHGLDVAAPRLLSPCDLEMKITVHQAARLHSWGSHNAS